MQSLYADKSLIPNGRTRRERTPADVVARVARSAFRSHSIASLQTVRNVVALKRITVGVQLGVSIVIATFISKLQQLLAVRRPGRPLEYDLRTTAMSSESVDVGGQK
jgi:hypothetical protein